MVYGLWFCTVSDCVCTSVGGAHPTNGLNNTNNNKPSTNNYKLQNKTTWRGSRVPVLPFSGLRLHDFGSRVWSLRAKIWDCWHDFDMRALVLANAHDVGADRAWLETGDAHVGCASPRSSRSSNKS